MNRHIQVLKISGPGSMAEIYAVRQSDPTTHTEQQFCILYNNRCDAARAAMLLQRVPHLHTADWHPVRAS